MHLAADLGNVELVKVLLEAGANPNARDEYNGFTILQGRRIYKWSADKIVEIVKLLLEAGANPNDSNSGSQTPLHRAAYEGNVEVIKMLLEAGANPNANQGRYTPLHTVAQDGNVEAVKMLLEAGANPNAPGLSGTPLASAEYGRDTTQGSIKPYQEIIRLLLEAAR